MGRMPNAWNTLTHHSKCNVIKILLSRIFILGNKWLVTQPKLSSSEPCVPGGNFRRLSKASGAVRTRRLLVLCVPHLIHSLKWKEKGKMSEVSIYNLQLKMLVTECVLVWKTWVQTFNREQRLTTRGHFLWPSKPSLCRAPGKMSAGQEGTVL